MHKLLEPWGGFWQTLRMELSFPHSSCLLCLVDCFCVLLIKEQQHAKPFSPNALSNSVKGYQQRISRCCNLLLICPFWGHYWVGSNLHVVVITDCRAGLSTCVAAKCWSSLSFFIWSFNPQSSGNSSNKGRVAWQQNTEATCKFFSHEVLWTRLAFTFIELFLFERVHAQSGCAEVCTMSLNLGPVVTCLLWKRRLPMQESNALSMHNVLGLQKVFSREKNFSSFVVTALFPRCTTPQLSIPT